MQGLSWCNRQTLQDTTWNDVQSRGLGAGAARRSRRCWPRSTAACSAAKNVVLLAHANGDDLFGLVVAANEIRRRLVGDVISYVVTRNINFTNVCFVGCKFCAFSVGPRDETAYFLSLDEIGAQVPRGRIAGARPKSASRAACRAICRRCTIATSCAR